MASSPTPLTRPTSRNLRVLRRLPAFVRPYAGHALISAVALTVAAGAVLAFGAGLRWLIDRASWPAPRTGSTRR